MSHKTTKLLEGVVINPETITATEDFYSDNKDTIVSVLRQLFPQVKHWRDIEKAEYFFKYYNPFKGLDTRFSVKEYFKNTVITATPRSVSEEGLESPSITLPDISTTPIEPPVEPPASQGFRFRVASPDSAKSEERFEVNLVEPSNDWVVRDSADKIVASTTIQTPDAVVVTNTSELVVVELKNLRNRTLEYTVGATSAKTIKLESTLTAARNVDVLAFDSVIKEYNFELPKVKLTVPSVLPKHIDNLSNMFNGSKLFNQDLSTWDTGHVTKMDGMFKGVESFNQDLSGWDVSSMAKEPVDFNEQTPEWVLPKPQWGIGSGEDGSAPPVTVFDLSTVTNVDFPGGISLILTEDELGTLSSAQKVQRVLDYINSNYASNNLTANDVDVDADVEDSSYFGLSAKPTSSERVIGRVAIYVVPDWAKVTEPVDSQGFKFTIEYPDTDEGDLGATIKITDREFDVWRLYGNGLLISHDTYSDPTLGGGDNPSVATIITTGRRGTTCEYTYTGTASSLELSDIETEGLVVTVKEYSPDCGGYTFPLASSTLTVPNELPAHISVTDNMFKGAALFNQDISVWDTSRLTSAKGMFDGAVSFNQDLSQWCVPNLTTEPDSFDLGAVTWSLPKPVWGSCPRGEVSFA